MATASKLAGILHEEHFWTVVLVGGLEAQIGEGAAEPAVDPRRPADRERLQELVRVLDDMLRHHAFEERVLFPMIRRRGHGAMADLFTDEHAAMGPLAKRLRRITTEILEGEGGMTPDRLAVFAGALAEFSEYVMLHIQKEELALVQKLHTFLDAATDGALATAYLDHRAAAARRAAG